MSNKRSKVMNGINIYSQFDEEIHCNGSAIWNKESWQHVKRPIIEKAGTEELVPRVSDESSKEENPENWQHAMKKKFHTGER